MFELLGKHHDRKGFDCGNEIINRYLQTMASQHAKKGTAKVHIVSDGTQIKGFYTLSAMSLDNSTRHLLGYPEQIPAVLIGRIGVDNRHKGQGLAALLISDAMHKIKQTSEQIGVAFAVIDAKNDALAQYYERLGFVRLPNSLRLVFATSQL